MIRTYLTIVFICYTILSFAQDKNIYDPIIKEDVSQPLENRSYDEDLSEKYSEGVYNYDTNEGESVNLISRFLNWLGDILNNTFGFNISPFVLQFIEILLYVLIGIAVIYFFVKFLIGENFSSLFTKKATPLVDINLSEEHIENIDLDILIKEALDGKNYRLAVRYHYLKILKNLSVKNIIQWEFEKTNSDYQNEITVKELKPLFQKVSYLYDYIWYGEQDIDETGFNDVETHFKTLKNNIPN